MIDNKICPYCACILVVSENKENSRSVEHLIPNTVLTRKRGNDEGDFYACRRCNSRKSKIDYVLSVVAKTQSRDATLASESLVAAISKTDGRVTMFKKMLRTVNETIDGGATMAIPISGIDLLEYMTFLAKGQYFKQHRTILDVRSYVLLCHFHNKEVSASFEASYEERFGSNNFRDLEENLYTEVIAPGESMIYCKNHKYMFAFHDYIVITVEVKKRNKKNIGRAATLNAAILEGFPTP
jgi:hypothetical protein